MDLHSFTISALLLSFITFASSYNIPARSPNFPGRYRIKTSSPVATGNTSILIGRYLRQNATWKDVDVWIVRDEVMKLAPIEFTVHAGREANTYMLHKCPTEQCEVPEFLGFSYGSPSPYPIGGSNTVMYLASNTSSASNGYFGNWTITKDWLGRTSLGLMDSDCQIQNKWITSGPEWNNYTFVQTDPDKCFGGICSLGVSDGYPFYPCGACDTQDNCSHYDCFGTHAVLELIQVGY